MPKNQDNLDPPEAAATPPDQPTEVDAPSVSLQPDSDDALPDDCDTAATDPPIEEQAVVATDPEADAETSDEAAEQANSTDLTAQQYRTHMEELWNLRPAYTRLAKAKFELEVRYEETTSQQQRALKKSLQAGVEIADELRRLVKAAQGDESGAETPPATLLSRFWGRKDAPAQGDGGGEWLEAFQRLWQLAVNRLEATGVYFVELLGKDLQTEQFEGHPIKRMVSVKNKPDGEALIVKQEICGLWIFKSKQQLVVVQRGEVLV